MKKLIAGLLLALVTSLGLVATTGSAAYAACDDAYNKCKDTKTTGSADKVKKKVVKVSASVKFRKGGGTPSGTFTFTCVGPNDLVEEFSKSTNEDGDAKKRYEFPKKGEWTCSVKFNPDNEKKQGPSSTSITFNV
jgi:hypothetical protein